MTELASKGVVDLNLGTVWNAWNDTWSGSVQDVNRVQKPATTNGNVRTTTTTISTTQRVGRTRSGIRTSLVPKEVRKSLGDKVIGTSLIPYMRSKSIEFVATGMKPNTRVYAFFDGVDVNENVTPLGSSAGAAITTDANGTVAGTFLIPRPILNADRAIYKGRPKYAHNAKLFRTGRRTFRLTSNDINSLTGDVFTSAEEDYVAKGLHKTVQGTIISTREAKFAKSNSNETTVVNRLGQRTESQTEIIEQRQYGGVKNSTPVRDALPRVNGAYVPSAATLAFIAAAHARAAAKNPPAVRTVHHAGNDNALVISKPRNIVKPSTRMAQGSTNGRGGRRGSARNSKIRGGCGSPYEDPVAQSFFVDVAGGLFISNIDLFFSSKSTAMPVTVELRTMLNGYPTREVLPFARVSVAAADVNVSADASTATTFTFPSPVFLQPNTEYCFVALTNTPDYTMYTARMGQKTLDDSRLISKQPYLGSMFKSQNGGTWTPEQNEDAKFTLNFCEFTNDVEGFVHLVNDEVPALILTKVNPISTTASSGVITIHHRNHGMHSTAANVTISGVASGTHNGIDSTNINGTYTTIDNIKLDSYTVTAQNSDTATATGDIGGTELVSVTRNILFDIIQPIIGSVIHQDTQLEALMRTTGGRTIGGSETEYELATINKSAAVALNSDYYMTKPGMIASQINETNEMSGSKSFHISIGLHSDIGNPNLSPVIDTQRLSAFLIQNRLDNPISGTTPDFVEETTNTGGSAATKYITKSILLENPATALDIRLSANVRGSSAVKMYYRTTSSEDVRLLGDVAWSAFNGDGSTDKAVPPAEDNLTFKEQQYSDTNIPAFTAFQLKIVMTGTNSSYPPLIKDMRGIALAV